jgi:hypothetical protein
MSSYSAVITLICNTKQVISQKLKKKIYLLENADEALFTRLRNIFFC